MQLFQSLQRYSSLLLVSLLTLEPGLFAAEPLQQKHVAAGTQLQGDQRILHALDRLTFGPRPGDLARVKAEGLDKWIDEQLHPERIDDSALESRLAEYPAMQLSLKDLLRRYPSPVEIRAVADGRESIPHGKFERAVYETQVAYYNERRKQEEAEAKAAPVTDAQAMMQGKKKGKEIDWLDGQKKDDENEASLDAQEEKLYNDLAATQLLTLPPDQRMDKILSMKPEELRALGRGLNPEERQKLVVDLSPEQREMLMALRSPQQLVRGELLAGRMLRDVDSERQLEAVMTDFWLNHFNIFLNKGQNAPWYLVDYERNVVRPRALGKFEDLLVATAKSPAMLFYLDNYQSVGPNSTAVRAAKQRIARNPGSEYAQKFADRGLNENYAREVMELHTLGVDGGYTQHDVTEVAKVFTGWTMDRPQQGGSEFEFDERRHEPGAKLVLGHEIKENGMNEGLEVLHMLATSPSTAHFLSKKLAIRFVSDDPPKALVNRMAATYLKSGGDIRAVLTTLFHSPEFWSRSAYRAKVKTPEEFVISALRASGGDLAHPMAAVFAMAPLGMSFYGMQTPNGYDWTANKWVNSSDLLNRINYSLALAVNRGGAIVHTNELLGLDAGAQPLTPEQVIAKLNQNILNGQLTAKTQKTILAQLEDPNMQDLSKLPLGQMNNIDRPTAQLNVSLKRERQAERDAARQMAQAPKPDDLQAAVVVGLLLGSPEFQRR